MREAGALLLLAIGAVICGSAYITPIFLIHRSCTRYAHPFVVAYLSDHHCQVISCRRVTFNKGPFVWSSSYLSPVFYIIVINKSNDKMEGWARCGRSLMFGILSNSDVDVVWRTGKPSQNLLD